MYSAVHKSISWVTVSGRRKPETFLPESFLNKFAKIVNISINNQRAERSCDMMKKLILAVLIIISLTVLTGCHTMHGVGQDIESAGESIQKATDK